jgi:hypothetical protein
MDCRLPVCEPYRFHLLLVTRSWNSADQPGNAEPYPRAKYALYHSTNRPTPSVTVVVGR